ncbi:Type II secretion system (T2SS), protein F [Candidatus Gugararchaeum adminiculabundum]|nr:Type II secretion system (T2SS), protein F [Candidatus Gugararchaeum adminiculabundum]
MIPFSLLPEPALMSFGKRFKGLGKRVSNSFPYLRVNLVQANMSYKPEEYCTGVITATIINFFVIAALILLLTKVNGTLDPLFAAALATLIAVFSFSMGMMHPAAKAKKRIRQIDDHLIPAIRQMYIEVKSGVTLFEGMKSIGRGYGGVSEEFAKITKSIEVGIPETNALNQASSRNPSARFRRVVWQISNSLVVGSDIANTLKELVDNMTQERMSDIKKYGAELNPFIMMYMMFAIVLPSLGISLMNVMLSFVNIPIPKIFFPIALFGLAGFQLFFLGFVSSKRPSVE